MTYSIIAIDAETGEIGIAVETRWPGVAGIVPWLAPGVGGIVTQGFTNVDMGPSGLDQLRGGQTAPVALRELIAADPGRDRRQVGIVDATGNSAAHTGSRSVAEAGHVCVPGVSVQGNMLARSEAWMSILVAYQEASGDLADRLMTALRAGERDGGDVRGGRSAALFVAPGSSLARPWVRRYDLRIDDSPRPGEELLRLLRVARAYEDLGAAIEAATSGELDEVVAHTTAALQLAPGDAHIAFWHATALAASERPDEAQPILEAALRAEPRLETFGRRYADAGHGGTLASALGGRADGALNQGRDVRE